MNENQTQQIQLFKSAFKGREDVFAVRWENGKKSGYMPAYSHDPYLYRTHSLGRHTAQKKWNRWELRRWKFSRSGIRIYK